MISPAKDSSAKSSLQSRENINVVIPGSEPKASVNGVNGDPEHKCREAAIH